MFQLRKPLLIRYIEQDPDNPGFPNAYADLSLATPPNILDVRRAFALQRYEEARARYGSRFVEYLRYLGIRPSDARLQRPEYLGGGKQTISFSEVLQTAVGEDEENVVGTMRGHGIAATKSRRYRRFFRRAWLRNVSPFCSSSCYVYERCASH